MSKRYIELRCSSEPSAEVQIISFEGENHLAVPVIALLGNSVVRASNAPTPEYIPSNVIENSVRSWNGRPCLPMHPKKNGTPVSANHPEFFDSSRMGFIFFSEYVDNKLKMLPYLNIKRCTDIGGDAKLAVEKLQAGESIDVSVGAIVETEEQKGMSLDGKEFGAVWVDLSGDHLAFLPNSKGACDQNMGCKAGISALSRKETTMPENDDNSSPVVAVDRAAEPKRDFFSRLLTKFRPAVIFDDGNSDDELRESLAEAIRSLDPAFDWICTVYPESGVVIYMTYILLPREYCGMYKYWRRTYTVDSEKKVTVNNDAIEVQPKRVWETVDEGVEVARESGSIVGAESKQPQLRAACDCQSNSKGEVTMATENDRKPVIDSLVAAGRFAEADRKSLESMSDDGWKAVSGLAESKKEETPVVAAAATPATPVAPPALTEAAVLEAFPDLNRIVTGYRASESKRKDHLIAQLSTAQKVYDEATLKAMSLERLEETANLVGLETLSPVDFSLRGIPSNPNADNETRAAASAAPDGYMAALNKGKKQAEATN